LRRRWDRNRDGIVTCDEWKAYAAELFDAADANHDGFVDRNEYATIVSTDRMFQTVEFSYYDTNGDGKRTALSSSRSRTGRSCCSTRITRAASTRARLPARVLTPSRYSTPRRRLPAIRARIARPA
jgi:EF hand